MGIIEQKLEDEVLDIEKIIKIENIKKVQGVYEEVDTFLIKIIVKDNWELILQKKEEDHLEH